MQVHRRVSETDGGLLLHVFNGAAEGVCDRAVVNRFFTQSKVCQLHVPWEENNTYSDGIVTLQQGPYLLLCP